MFKKLVPLILFDVLVGFSFVFSNSYFWNYLNGYLTRSEWSPLQISIAHMIVIHGDAVPAGLFTPIINYPFILFWIALVGNFVFVILVLRSKEKES